MHSVRPLHFSYTNAWILSESYAFDAIGFGESLNLSLYLLSNSIAAALLTSGSELDITKPSEASPAAAMTLGSSASELLMMVELMPSSRASLMRFPSELLRWTAKITSGFNSLIFVSSVLKSVALSSTCWLDRILPPYCSKYIGMYLAKSWPKGVV